MARKRLPFVNRSEALQAAAYWDQQLKEYGTRGVKQLSHAQLQIALQCFNRLQPYGDYQLVEATENHIKALTRCLVTKPIAELCDAYEQECERHLRCKEMKQRNVETVRDTTKKLKVEFGSVLICNLYGPTFKQWLTTLPLAARTRNRHLEYTRRIFNWAIEQEWLPDNPLAKVKPFNEPKMYITAFCRLRNWKHCSELLIPS